MTRFPSHPYSEQFGASGTSTAPASVFAVHCPMLSPQIGRGRGSRTLTVLCIRPHDSQSCVATKNYTIPRKSSVAASPDLLTTGSQPHLYRVSGERPLPTAPTAATDLLTTAQRYHCGDD